MIRHLFCSLLIVTAVFQLKSPADVVINEFSYDDGGTDDREFVELYNNGLSPVGIGGWTLGGQDQAGPNSTVTITAGATINPGAFYVIGQTGVPNVNQFVTGGSTGFWENDGETLELRNAGLLQDAVVYESAKGPTAGNLGGYGVLPADVVAQVGPGIWGNNASVDLPGTPKLSSASLARYVDGLDTNNNGRDFGFRASTPGTSNNPINITKYTPPDVSALPVGAVVTNFAYGFVPPHVIDPTVADTYNPNAIPRPPTTASRAIIAWDPSGTGNAISSTETFATRQSKFDIYAYFDTRPLPPEEKNTTSNSQLPGSEMTIYGIGGTDAFGNVTDLAGHLGVPDTSNGTTGVAWVLEKVVAPNPSGPQSPSNMPTEMLYLVDAKDGGDAGLGGTRPIAWSILASIDLTTLASDWYRLGIDIDAQGNGVARFNNQFFNFVTAQHSGAFSVAYFENAAVNNTVLPLANLRPPTFVAVPEPTTIACGVIALVTMSLYRQRQASMPRT